MTSHTSQFGAFSGAGDASAAKTSIFWTVLETIRASRGRRLVVELAKSTAQSRPELAAPMREATLRDWS